MQQTHKFPSASSSPSPVVTPTFLLPLFSPSTESAVCHSRSRQSGPRLIFGSGTYSNGSRV
ncbi:hypothetical protein JCM5353_003146, partial [Sporobolomyces roseus]